MKFKVTINERQYQVQIIDLDARPVQVKVNGIDMEVWPSDTGVEPLEKSSSSLKPAPISDTINRSGADIPISAVLAPIPGVVSSIAVRAGSQVKMGQELCVLEAMKMKNVIRSNREGRIAVIKVTIGQHVRHHETLFEIEPLKVAG